MYSIPVSVVITPEGIAKVPMFYATIHRPNNVWFGVIRHLTQEPAGWSLLNRINHRSAIQSVLVRMKVPVQHQ